MSAGWAPETVEVHRLVFWRFTWLTKPWKPIDALRPPFLLLDLKHVIIVSCQLFDKLGWVAGAPVRDLVVGTVAWREKQLDARQPTATWTSVKPFSALINNNGRDLGT